MSSRAGSVQVAHPLFFQVEGGGSIPTSALQLRFEKIGMKRAQELNRAWHSVLPKTVLGNLVRNRRYIAYVASFDGIHYAVAIWTDPVAAHTTKDGDRKLELRRMAIQENAPKNTASRMIGWMVKDVKRRWPELVGLLSFQCTENHSGTIYKASGWHSTGETQGVNWAKHQASRVRQNQVLNSKKVRWEYRYETAD